MKLPSTCTAIPTYFLNSDRKKKEIFFVDPTLDKHNQVFTCGFGEGC